MKENKGFTVENIADVISVYGERNNCDQCKHRDLNSDTFPCRECCSTSEISYWEFDRDLAYPIANAIINYCCEDKERIEITQKDNNIYYLVELWEDAEYESLILNSTTLRGRKFCGKLLYTSNGKGYFELNGSKALAVMPFKYIKMLAPSNMLWNKENNDGNK